MKLVVCIAAVLAASIQPALAQQAASGPPSLSLAPAVVIVRAKFGQTVTQTISLHNATAVGLAYEMSAQDVVVKNGKRTFVRAGESPNSIAASAIFSRRSGYIAPLSDGTVQVLLTIPAQTSIRGVVVYFRNKHVVAGHGSVMLSASLGSLITFILTNDVALEAQPMHVYPPTASENMRIVDSLSNTGSEPVVADGVAAFVGSGGTLAAKVQFASQRLMPGERLEMTAEYPGRLKPGRYRVLCTFSYEGKSLTVTGAYVAT